MSRPFPPYTRPCLHHHRDFRCRPNPRTALKPGHLVVEPISSSLKNKSLKKCFKWLKNDFETMVFLWHGPAPDPNPILWHLSQKNVFSLTTKVADPARIGFSFKNFRKFPLHWAQEHIDFVKKWLRKTRSKKSTPLKKRKIAKISAYLHKALLCFSDCIDF